MNILLMLLSTALFSSGLNFPAIKLSNHLFAAPTTTYPQHLAHLSQVAPKLDKKVLQLALVAYNHAALKGSVKKPILTVIDYSRPSFEQRMWVFDLKHDQLLYNTYVAHGRNSGNTTAKHFSNKIMSKETSLGIYVTRDSYIGSKGLSLNLEGLEKGFNDNAYNRRVVIHGAWYVEPNFIKQTGHAGRSWGCPSIAKTLAKPVINTLKNGEQFGEISKKLVPKPIFRCI